MRFPRIHRAVTAALVTSALAACGGGGGGSSDPVVIDPPVGGTPTPTPSATPTPSPSPTPTATPTLAPLVFITEEEADSTAALYAVRTDGSGKQLLDSGGFGYRDAVLAGGKVVFSRVDKRDPQTLNPAEQHVYAVNLDGTARQPITVGASLDEFEALVGDRVIITRRFAASGSTDSNTDVFSVKIDGTDLKPLANDPVRDESVSRAVGDQVIIQSQLKVGTFVERNHDIYVAKADGSTPKIPIAVSAEPETVVDVVGERIIFQTWRQLASGSTAASELYSRRLDGSGLVALTNSPESEQLGEVVGERLFIKKSTLNAQGGVISELIESINADGTGKISPFVPNAFLRELAGDKLIFSRAVAGIFQLFSIAIQGGGAAAQLTNAAESSELRGVVGDTLIVRRAAKLGSGTQLDLYAVRLTPAGAQETALAISSDEEAFNNGNAANGRLLFTRFIPRAGQVDRREVFSVALDGTGLVRLLGDSKDSEFIERVGQDGRIIISRYVLQPSGGLLTELIAVDIDGKNPVAISAAKTGAELLD